MMTRYRLPYLVGVIQVCLLISCSPSTASSTDLPFTLVTIAPNASPTSTPFQPSFTTPTRIESEFILPTETPSPLPTQPLEPTATADLATLFPTSAAPPPSNPEVQPEALPALTDQESINFLLIGSDQRSGLSYRTDTLVIAIMWPSDGQVSLISIPRDLWIYIPMVGMQRINTAYQSGEINSYQGGGPGLLKDTIQYNLGIRIDHTAMVDFDGFRRIVDTLGGVDLPVSCPYTDWRLIDPSFDPYDENNWWLYSVGPGQIHMDGDLALWYARSRSKSNDFDRGRRQQEVLRAIFTKALQTETFSKIPQLYLELSQTVVTDLGLNDLIRMAPYALKMSNADIRSYYIRPPYVSAWTTPGGASVQLPNEASLTQLLAEATSFSRRVIERESIQVEVQNGSQVESMDTLAAFRLNYAGYQTQLAPADRRDYLSSVVIDHTPGQDAAKRAALISNLGLNSADQISLPDSSSSISYRVILGADYDSCFKPEEIPH
jgi:LCP family protein required for cell wall assembly